MQNENETQLLTIIIGIDVLCPRAQCARRKVNSKTGTLFLLSKSIGAFNVGIGRFPIRLADQSLLGLIGTAQSITIACPCS